MLPAGWRAGDTACEPSNLVDTGLDHYRDRFRDIPGGPYACFLMPAKEVPFGGKAAAAHDVTVCERAEPHTTRMLSRLNTSAAPGKLTANCAIAIKFDLRGEIPPNMTAKSAILTLWADPEHNAPGSERSLAYARNATVRNIMVPWDWRTAKWSNFPPSVRNESAPQPIDYLEEDRAPTAFLGPAPMSFDVTRSVEAAFRGYGTHLNGWWIADASEETGPCTQTQDCKRSFYSSAALTQEGRPQQPCANTNGHRVGNQYIVQPLCWPSLRVVMDPNRAIPRNLTFHYNTTSSLHRTIYHPTMVAAPDSAIWMSGKTAFNISIDGEDPLGRIDRGWYEIRNKTGVLYVREEFQHKAFNRTFDPIRNPGDRSVLWTVRAFDLPEDRYYVNVTLRDVDGWLMYLNMTRHHPVLWIDNKPPRMEEIRIPAAVDQGRGANVTLRLTDARGIGSAAIEITTPSGRTETFKVRPLTTEPFTKNGVWFFNRTWFEPGLHTVRIRVNDTLGNVNVTDGLSFRVIDVRAPVPCGSEVQAADRRFGVWVQEQGGPLRVQACARDETPLVGHLRLTHASGAERTYPLVLVAGTKDTFRLNLTAPEPPGRYRGLLTATDTDNNVATVATFELDVEPPLPPSASNRIPAPNGWANATPVLSVTFRDLNIERTSIRMEMRVGDDAWENLSPLVTGTGPEAVATVRGFTFSHGERVALRASANDTLGNAAPATTWEFSVDTRAPRLNLTLVGPRAPGPVANYVTRATLVNWSATDGAGAGFDRLEARWRHVATSLETPWRAVAGDIRLAEPQVDRGAGLYDLALRAVDRVGNVAPLEEVRFVLDPHAPNVTVLFAPGELHVDATDQGAGLARLLVGARLLGEGAFRIHDLTDETTRLPQGGRFTVPSTVVGKGEVVEYYVVAEDRLGQRFDLGSPVDPRRHVGRNHAPVLAVDGPSNDTVLKGPLEMTWTASDPDGESVRVDVRIRPTVLSAWEDLAVRAPPRGTVSWDTRGTPDGLYVLEVVARDQESATRHFVNVVVDNTGKGVGRVVGPDGRVEYLETVRFEVTLYRPVIDAKVRVHELRGSERKLVSTHPLLDDGTSGDRTPGDGVYTAIYPASTKGRYVTDVEVVYADAGTVVVQGAAVYSVKSSVSNAIERNFLWLLLGGVVMVGVAAWVVVQLMRYGYI